MQTKDVNKYIKDIKGFITLCILQINHLLISHHIRHGCALEYKYLLIKTKKCPLHGCSYGLELLTYNVAWVHLTLNRSYSAFEAR